MRGQGSVQEAASEAAVEADAPEEADAQFSCDGGAQPLGMLTEPCCNKAELACMGHAQKLVLICDPKTLTWGALQSCSGNLLCDTTPGTNQGTCQEPVPACVGKQPGDKLCDGLKAIVCGPDLLTAQETLCTNACKDGACVGSCQPGARRCTAMTPELCDENGVWSAEAPCTYLCTGDGQCSGNCTPGLKQCNGLTPQICDTSGEWQDGTPCAQVCSSGECAVTCAEGTKQCSGGVAQTCTGGKWQDSETCPFLCSSGVCIGTCSPGTAQCAGLTPQSCDTQGAWQNGAACAYVCNAGTCSGVCAPGSKDCNGLTPRTCDSTGAWQSGAPCAYVCSAGACSGVCTPNDKKCNGQVPQTCTAAGQWQDGTACPYVCTAGTCAGACSAGAKQCNGLVPQTCNAQGTWDDGAACTYACQNGSCTGTCVPGTKQCNGLVPQSCDANGQWLSAPACQDQACVGGVCTGACTPDSKQCAGSTPQTCDGAGVWQNGTPCSGSKPMCSAGLCLPAGVLGLSCIGLAPTCGPSGADDCCAGALVPGGTYNRANDAGSPATVSDFKLDKYEISVGRFRSFIAAYSQNMISAGAGKNPNNPADTGWDVAWNAMLPANAAAFTSVGGLRCNTAYETWTDIPGSNESRPIMCLNWFEAYAFCIWDGGRLPTEAEWNYAAAGGSEQRKYPWGDAALGANANIAAYGCYFNGAGTCTGVTNIAPVGFIPAGNGKWGHSDLAGNAREWVQDWYAAFEVPCTNCAALSPLLDRVNRGGNFSNNANSLVNATRNHSVPSYRSYHNGGRCARTP
jgi:formylglycine-generating enzyme required for sulfatase activity